MTLANKITITRILLIPVFVLFAVYYGHGRAEGHSLEWQRYVAIFVFILAAASDGLDGFVARRLKQRSKLGAILDPIADKGLLLAAIITLSFSKWNDSFPIWFPVLVVARDAVIVSGYLLLRHLNEYVEVRPSWTGKTATACQMAAIAWVMLQLPNSIYAVYAAGVFTFLSGAGYVAFGIRQLHCHDSRQTEKVQ